MVRDIVLQSVSKSKGEEYVQEGCDCQEKCNSSHQFRTVEVYYIYIEDKASKDGCDGVYVLKKDASSDFFLDFKLLHQCVRICAQYIIVAYLY